MPGATAPEPATRRGMGGRALLISGATMVSRVLGLVRDVLFAALLGATAFADAYKVGFRIPNLLRDLFAEGALSSAFVPTFADTLRNQGREHAIRLANAVIGAVLVIVGGVTLIGVLAAPAVVGVLGEGFDETPGKHELAVLCTRIMFPFLPLVSLAAIVMGQLNAEERYTAPAFASAFFNVVSILAGTLLWFGGARGEAAAIGWSIGTVLGGAAQFAVQVPSLRQTGFRFRPRLDWADAGLRRIGRLMGPATIGLAATQVNIAVNTAFASQVEGGVSWLDYAFRLMQLPIGVFGVAVATIATTRLARAAAERDLGRLSETFGQGLRLVAFLTVPCTFGLVALREPIVRLIYERGAFQASDTRATAAALLMYAVGLYCYSAVKVAAPAFYALDRARVPMIASFLAVAVNLALNFLLFPYLSWRGLALGTAAAATVNFLVLFLAFRGVSGGFRAAPLALHLARVVLAALPCAAVAWLVTTTLEGALGTSGLTARVAAVGAGIAAGAGVYVVACRLLRVRELDDVTGFVRQRRSQAQ